MTRFRSTSKISNQGIHCDGDEVLEVYPGRVCDSTSVCRDDLTLRLGLVLERTRLETISPEVCRFVWSSFRMGFPPLEIRSGCL